MKKICKEFLLRKNKNNEFNPPLLLIGSYTYNNPKLHKNGQFDIVTYSEIGYTFYECKFTNNKIDKSIFLEEINQLKQANITNYKLGFFSKVVLVMIKNFNLVSYLLYKIYIINKK